jgi:hypothetical protein
VIFLVDPWGGISVCDARFLREVSDPTLLILLRNCTWCFSMSQASEVARERRKLRGVAPF